jgi:hypothetical protein
VGPVLDHRFALKQSHGSRPSTVSASCPTSSSTAARLRVLTPVNLPGQSTGGEGASASRVAPRSPPRWLPEKGWAPGWCQTTPSVKMLPAGSYTYRR